VSVQLAAVVYLLVTVQVPGTSGKVGGTRTATELKRIVELVMDPWFWRK
jgi:hypothetical protein